MQLVEAKELSKTFSTFKAVDKVTLGVARGEVVGFLGPNGAGKSTTMRMIAGFLEPDGGSAAICGHDVMTDAIAARRRLGYLPEGAPAYADMSVGSFLTFCGRMRGLRGAVLEDRLAEMVDRVNLAEVWNRQIDALSKGFKRRVGIAQALIHDPDVLILDEPTDGLDPNQKHDMRELIRAMAPGKAIVVSTHILEEVDAVCSRAVIIAAGKVVADATPSELLARAAGQQAIRVTIATSTLDLVLERLRPIVPGARLEVAERVNGTISVLLFGSGLVPASLAGELVKANLSVEEIGIWKPRLEDVFRSITRPANDSAPVEAHPEPVAEKPAA